MKYDFTRSDWNAAPAAKVVQLNWNRVLDLIVHYPGSNAIIGGDANSIRKWIKGWQTYHKNGRGWSDIAYNVAVDQEGRLWELRGWDRVDGATANRGGISFSILAIVGNNETPSDAMKSKILEVFDYANTKAPKAKRGWHSQFSSTSCPGDALRNWGKAGFPAPNVITTSPLVVTTPMSTPTLNAPDFPLDNGCHSHGTNAYFGPKSGPVRSVSGYFSHRDDLRHWQQRMKDRGWRISPDGLYGDETRRVATDFQREKGLAADGLIGHDTWQAAWTSQVT